MAWLVDKVRRKKREKESFRVSTVMEKLEREGFKPIVKSDILESRRLSIDEDLATILTIVNNPTIANDKKGEAIDQLMRLTFLVASPWLRSMDNPWLSHKMNCFIQNYREWRKLPEMFDHLVEEAKAIINLSMTNIDVEPLTPIIIQTVQPFGGGFGETLPTSGGRISQTYGEMVQRPKGGPYPNKLDADVKE